MTSIFKYERRCRMSEENKALARREVEEIFTQGKLDVADEIYASDFVDYDLVLPQTMNGPEEMKEYVDMYRSAFPDLRVTLEDQVAEGDKVVNRWTAQGTHQGEYRGVAPTGKEVEFAGMHKAASMRRARSRKIGRFTTSWA
jgi:steroid delta-isomerase-like uncharacterized protein